MWTAQACVVEDIDLTGPCGQPAVAVLTSGCVHEHVTTDAVCADHDPIQHGTRMVCRPCWTNPDDEHECRMAHRYTPHTLPLQEILTYTA